MIPVRSNLTNILRVKVGLFGHPSYTYGVYKNRIYRITQYLNQEDRFDFIKNLIEKSV